MTICCELLVARVGYPVVTSKQSPRQGRSPRARRNVAQRSRQNGGEMKTQSHSLRLGAAVALAAVLFLPPPRASHAAGIPVSDSAALARLISQLTQMGQIYTRQNEELTQAIRLVQSLTNATAYGTSLDTAALAALRTALPAEMSNLNSLHITGHATTARSVALFNTLTDRYGLMEPDAYNPADPTTTAAQAWRANRNAQLATAVSTQVVYDSLEEREAFYTTAMSELDTRAELKESVDLLARLTAENGRLLMDLIRVQAQAAQATVATRLNEETHRAKMRKVGAYVDTDYPW